MKKINILLVLLFVLLVSCNKHKKIEEEEVLPTYFTLDNYYTSQSGEGFGQLNNGIVYFRKANNPTISFVLNTNNKETKNGVFPITQGKFNYNLGTTYEDYNDFTGGDIGTITITKNTNTYLQGSYIYKSQVYNKTTNLWETKTFTGTFSGRKN